LILFAGLLKQLKFSAGFTLFAIIYLALGSSLDKHLRVALLDNQILIWSLSFFLVLFHKNESWLKYVLVGLVLGGLISTKYFFPISLLYLSLLGVWAIYHKTWLKILLTVFVAGSTYLASYLAYFSQPHSLIEFVKFEWFRFRWWTGNRTIPKFILLQTILLGKFPMWWETGKKYQLDGDWNLSWPILFIGHLLASLKPKSHPPSSYLDLCHWVVAIICWFSRL
jgi:hypothetical protein